MIFYSERERERTLDDLEKITGGDRNLSGELEKGTGALHTLEELERMLAEGETLNPEQLERLDQARRELGQQVLGGTEPEDTGRGLGDSMGSGILARGLTDKDDGSGFYARLLKEPPLERGLFGRILPVIPLARFLKATLCLPAWKEKTANWDLSYRPLTAGSRLTTRNRSVTFRRSVCTVSGPASSPLQMKKKSGPAWLFRRLWF